MSATLKPEDLAETREKVHDLSLGEILNFLKAKKNFYAGYLSQFTKTADPNEQTMSVTILNARYVLRYNPEWYKYLEKEEVETVIEHESLHLILGHIPRFHRIKDSLLDEEEQAKMASVANAAADLAINSLLKDFKHNKIPNSALLPRGYGLPDKKSMDYYLYELMDRVKIKEVTVSVGACVESESSANSGPGDSPGGGDGKESSGEVTSEDENLNELMKNQHNWDMTETSDDLSDEDMASRPTNTKDIEAALEAQAQKALKDAVKEISGGSSRGVIPDFIKEKLSEQFITGTGTQTWKRLLSRYVRDTKDKLSEFRINAPRRQRWSLDQDLGAYGSEVENLKFSVEVGIDTSGSMSSKTLTEILEFTQGLMQMDEEIQVRITQYDTRISRQYLLSRYGKVETTVHGRGGTNFNAFFRDVRDLLKNKASKYRPDIVFNFTDGEAPPPRGEYRFSDVPLIWVLKQHGRSPCPEYGKSISM